MGHVYIVESDAMVRAGGVGRIMAVDALPEDLLRISPLRAA